MVKEGYFTLPDSGKRWVFHPPYSGKRSLLVIKDSGKRSLLAVLAVSPFGAVNVYPLCLSSLLGYGDGYMLYDHLALPAVPLGPCTAVAMVDEGGGRGRVPSGIYMSEMRHIDQTEYLEEYTASSFARIDKVPFPVCKGCPFTCYS